MSDLISREDAIEVLSQRARILQGEYGDLGGACSGAMKIIESLPSAEPERKKGKWLPHPHEREWDVCSVCGTGCKRREFEMQFGQEKFTEYGYRYCPFCGAEMTR